MQLSSQARKAVAIGLAASTILTAAAGMAPSFASAAVHSDGCLVLSGGTVWMITGGTRRGYTSAEVFQSWGYNFSEVVVASAEDVALPVGPIQVYADGTLVKGPSDPLVYLVAAGQKRPFVSGSVFSGLGYSFANIQQAPSNTFADLPTGSNLDSTTIAHPAGTQVISNGAVWWMDVNGRRGFTSGAQFNSYGYKFSHVVAASSYDLASPNLGDVPNRASCTGGGGTPPPPPSGSFSVSLASDNPAAGVHASGTAYNPALKLNFNSGSSSATISGVTITRSGISTDANISGVAAFDLSGMRLTNSFNTFSDNKAVLTFATPLSIPAGSSTSVTIKTNISGTSGTYMLSLASAADVNTSGGVSGSFPINGNTFTMVSGSSTVGNLTADAVTINSNGAADVTAVNVNLGTLAQVITKFRFSQANGLEDVNLKSVTMYNNGNTNDGDITNIKLLAPDGSTVASLPQTSGRWAKFVLSTPYKIAKGTTRDFTVIGDVVNGSSRTFRLVIQNDFDIEVSGIATGSGILATAAGTVDGAFPLGDVNAGSTSGCTSGIVCINKITVASGTALFAKANDAPSGNIAAGATSATLGKWEFTPQGENMEVHQIAYTLTYGTALTGTFRIQLNGSTIYSVSGGSTPATTVASGNLTTSTFVTLPVGVKAIFTAVGDINASASSGASYLVALDVTQVKRMSTGDLVDPGVTNTSGNTLTVSTAALTAAKNSSFGDTTVVAGLSNAKAGSFNLTASSTEDVVVSSITLGLTNTTNVSNVMLMNGITQLGSTITSPSSSNVFSLSGVTVPKGTTMTVDVMITTNGSTTGTEVTSISAVSANGKDSSATVTTTGLTATGQTITFSVAGSMTVTLDTTNTPVLGIARSGEVDRTLLATRLTTNNAEAVKVTTVQVSATNGTASLRDLKLFVNGVQKGTTTQLNNGVASFTDTSSTGLFSVLQDTTSTLTVKGSTTSTGTLNSQAVGVVAIDFIQALGASGGTTIKPGTTLNTTWSATNTTITGASVTVADTTGFHKGDVVFAYATGSSSIGIVTAEPTSTTAMTVATIAAVTRTSGSTISKIETGASTAASAGTALRAGAALTVTSTKAFTVGDPVIVVDEAATRLGWVSAIGTATSMTIRTTTDMTGTAPVQVSKLGTDTVSTGITATTSLTTTTAGVATTVTSTTGFQVGDFVILQDTTAAGGFGVVTAISSSTGLSIATNTTVTPTSTSSATLVRVGSANPSTSLTTTTATAFARVIAATASTVADTTGFGAGDVVISATTAGTPTAVNAILGVVTTVTNATSVTIGSAAADAAVVATRVTRLPGAASAGATITFHDVEPTITVNSGVASGTYTGQSGQAVAMYDIKADGDRNMNITSVNVQASGNNLPWNYVTTYDLYNGSTLLSSATQLNSATTAATTTSALTGTTIELCTADVTAAGEIRLASAGVVTAAALHINVNDTIVLFQSTSNYITAKVTAKATGSSCSVGGAATDVTLTVTNSSTTGTAPTQATITALKSFNVYFDSSASTPLATQTVTAGSTLTLTVKADTTAVKTGLSTSTASYNTKINGVQGASNGGLTWGYTPSGGSAITGLTSSDSYPVNGPTLNY